MLENLEFLTFPREISEYSIGSSITATHLKQKKMYKLDIF